MVRRVKQPWRLDQPEKVALIDQDVEFRRAIPAVIPVVEINPKPDAPLAVVHVNGSAIERVRMGQKNYHGRWELNPPKDLGVFGKLEKLGHSFIQRLSFGKTKHMTAVQISEH
jgi:hypothetical protein